MDTSAWIAFLRPGSSEVSDQVEGLIERDSAALVGPVLAELLHGIRGNREASRLGRLLSILPYHEILREDWQAAGASLRGLRRKGITIPLTDAVIAAVARRRGLAVLSLDHHFDSLDVIRMPLE